MDPQKALKKLKIELPEGYSPNNFGVTKAFIDGKITADKYKAYDSIVNPSSPIWDFTKDFFGQVYDSGMDLTKTYGPALIKRIQSAFL